MSETTPQAITKAQAENGLLYAGERFGELAVDETLPERARQTFSEARMHISGLLEITRRERL